MAFPIEPPIEPMLSKPLDTLPEGDFSFEPKWDGFRTLVFRDGDELYLQSRELRPLLRYFPELRAPLLERLPERCVLDGELVVARNGALDFEALQLRIHPAKSRIDKLAKELAAEYVAFDLLALGDDDLRGAPQRERRRLLEGVLEASAAPIHLSPATTDRGVASDWFARFEGAGLDGVMAKDPLAPYQPGKRVLFKIKHARTCDCVVAGFRWHKDGVGERVGSLILGLFDETGALQHVGITATFTMKRRAELVAELAPLRDGAERDHPWAKWMDEAPEPRHPGMQSRWSQGKDLSFVMLRPERVVEVKFDHLEGRRFRHATTFVRWRPDREPRSCTYDQIEIVPPYELSQIFGR
jgi:ATP-dependent DNA ligase